ncbi:DNA glycosylase AlkZ-like family protein [Microbacterium fluvii]|uniref:DNA glycosylase AlkZ-like family protein n=1 Tax=Microbacterium fluvii TaxID=415215 RepID=A0ABW2HE30_9MICO|nr:crosslink repair DNA glycosylase YcaQ family protein [Microbacterium fluvii]MCU4672335.1 winged helix DNA-binding domain-containing protein [Microbacterium fluvii]
MRTLSRGEARRVAVTAQLLSAERPADIMEALDGLGAIDTEPTAAVAGATDLVLWTRLGWPYQPSDLARLIEQDRAVFEWGGFLRPMADLPLFLPVMRAGPRYREPREWLDANAAFRRDVLAQLRERGPQHPVDIPDTAQVSWRSTGWTNNRNSSQMLEILLACGQVAVSGRDAKGRLFDLAERVYPADVDDLTEADAALGRAWRRLGSLGIARRKALTERGDDVDPAELGEIVQVAGTQGEWHLDPVLRDAPFAGRTALLSPFDRLVFDRDRIADIFGFEYILEMYKPAAQRRWGYFALPILRDDALVGKLDARADRKAGVLRVAAVHEDVVFDEQAAADVDREIAELAHWLGLEVVRTG